MKVSWSFKQQDWNQNSDSPVTVCLLLFLIKKQAGSKTFAEFCVLSTDCRETHGWRGLFLTRGPYSSSCDHTSVPRRTWGLVQTGCRGEAFQGRRAELGEYNAHPPIPTCKTLPRDHASPSKWEQISLCKNHARKTISVTSFSKNVRKA